MEEGGGEGQERPMYRAGCETARVEWAPGFDGLASGRGGAGRGGGGGGGAGGRRERTENEQRVADGPSAGAGMWAL